MWNLCHRTALIIKLIIYSKGSLPVQYYTYCIIYCGTCSISLFPSKTQQLRNVLINTKSTL